MKFASGYIYQAVTAVIFALLALLLWLKPDVAGNIRSEWRPWLIGIFALWAVFRASTSWFSYKRKKREEDRA